MHTEGKAEREISFKSPVQGTSRYLTLSVRLPPACTRLTLTLSGSALSAARSDANPTRQGAVLRLGLSLHSPSSQVQPGIYHIIHRPCSSAEIFGPLFQEPCCCLPQGSWDLQAAWAQAPTAGMSASSRPRGIPHTATVTSSTDKIRIRVIILPVFTLV